MMKMSGRVMCCCVVLLLTLTFVSSVQRLHSINELNRIDQDLYMEISALLSWFVNTAKIHDNEIQLTFDPQRGDYGSHHYGNYEGMLVDPRTGHQYYTLGNIHQDRPEALHLNRNYNGRNRGRIIVSIRRPNPGLQARRIDRVYITQHYVGCRDGAYDPDHTYEISTQLLRNMRDDQISFREQSARYTPQSYNYRDHHQENQWSVMQIFFILLLLVFIIVIILANLPQPKSRWQ